MSSAEHTAVERRIPGFRAFIEGALTSTELVLQKQLGDYLGPLFVACGRSDSVRYSR